MVKPKKEKQQTLEAALGRPRVRPTIKTPKAKGKSGMAISSSASSSPARNLPVARSSPIAPPSSFMHSSQVGGSVRKRKVVLDEDSSSEDASENDHNEGDEVELALPASEAKRGRKSQESDSSLDRGSLSQAKEHDEGHGDNWDEGDDNGGDGDDMPLITPTPKRKRRVVLDSDEDDRPLASSPIKRRRRLVRGNAAPSSAKQRSSSETEDGDEEPALSVRVKRRGRKPRTKKEKARELLRRKRAGEAIEEDEDSSSYEEEEPAKAMYDTDSDNLALNEFDDDEEGVPEIDVGGSKKKTKETREEKEAREKGETRGKKETRDKRETREKKETGEGEKMEEEGGTKERKKKKETDDDESRPDESMDDFVVDDSDAPLGVPEEVYANMPLEFTAHSHKPLKEHFRDAIEWLVQFKINPGFSEKEHALYRMAWKKLDDEVRGLAQSKFSSSAWKVDFNMALRARPYFSNPELPKGNLLEAENCGACGRSGHPARYVISFTGTPYFKDSSRLDRLLLPIESYSSDSDGPDTGSSDSSHDEDEDGNPIPKEAKQWYIGATCNSNAETAHNLMHWKHALLDWVDTRLHEEGHMAPSKLAERERMRPKQKYKLVDEILQRWVQSGVVIALYQDFKTTIEQARNKPTTGRYR